MKINKISTNETEVILSNATVFFSYNTPVAAVINGVSYKTEKKWSVTTSRHIKQWLGEADYKTAEIKPQSFFDNLVNV